MFRIGQTTERTCSGIARRELLQVGGVGALGLSLADVLRAEASGARAKAADA